MHGPDSVDVLVRWEDRALRITKLGIWGAFGVRLTSPMHTRPPEQLSHAPRRPFGGINLGVLSTGPQDMALRTSWMAPRVRIIMDLGKIQQVGSTYISTQPGRFLPFFQIGLRPRV